MGNICLEINLNEKVHTVFVLLETPACFEDRTLRSVQFIFEARLRLLPYKRSTE